MGPGPWALGPKIAAPGRSLGPRDFWAQGPLGPGPNGPRALARAQIGLGEWVGQGQAIKYIIYYILYNLKPSFSAGVCLRRNHFRKSDFLKSDVDNMDNI